MKQKVNPAKVKKATGYKYGGKVSAGSPCLKPTNQKTVRAKGMGAATRGGNFKA